MNRISRLISIVVILVVFSPGFTLGAAELQAGAAAADITPDVNSAKITLGGYGARGNKPATGVHDPVMAKVLVLRSGPDQVAIVTMDLVGVSRWVRSRVIELLKGTGIDDHNLLVTASHTHSGPVVGKRSLVALVFGGNSPELAEETASRIASAVKKAQSSLAPATLRSDTADIQDATRNRRDPSYNYNTRRFTNDYDPSDSENITDPTLTVLRVDGLDGEPLAVLVHFATHATVLGSDNFLISADWPGVLQRDIEKAYPGAVALYMNGVQGDQAPTMPDDPDDFECIELIGSRIAAEALDLIESAGPVEALPIKSVIVRRRIPVSGKIGIEDYHLNLTLPRSVMNKLLGPMPLMALRVGDVVFMGCPLEMISEIGLTMKHGAQGLGVKVPIVSGLANDLHFYCTTPDEYDQGGYEAGLTVYGKIEAGLVIGEQMMLTRRLME